MSEFRSLQGLRNALRNDLEKGVVRYDPIQKVSARIVFASNSTNVFVSIFKD